MNVLLLDLGNTRLKLATVDTGAADLHLAAVTSIAHASDGFPVRLRDALTAMPDCALALLASVAPAALRLQVLDAIAAVALPVESVAVEPVRPDLRIAYPHPERFGVDRWLALLGARRAHAAHPPAAHPRAGDRPDDGTPLLVANCGTALTVDLADGAGTHLGGLIAASPTLMHEALRQRAPHLPPMAVGEGRFACDTAEALHAGCQGAAAALLERALRQATALLSTTPRLLLTGGGAPALLPVLTTDGVQASYHPALVLEGLAQLARERAG